MMPPILRQLLATACAFALALALLVRARASRHVVVEGLDLLGSSALGTTALTNAVSRGATGVSSAITGMVGAVAGVSTAVSDGANKISDAMQNKPWTDKEKVIFRAFMKVNSTPPNDLALKHYLALADTLEIVDDQSMIKLMTADLPTDTELGVDTEASGGDETDASGEDGA